MTAIGAEAGLLDEDGTPPQHRADPGRRLARRGRGRRRAASRPTPATSSPPSGVGEGARTGLASVVTGVLFLVTILLAPLVRADPVGGRRPGAGAGRLPDDAAGHGHRLGRPRDRDPGVPDDRADAVHLLDHRRASAPGSSPTCSSSWSAARPARCTRCCGSSRRLFVALLRDRPDHRLAHLSPVDAFARIVRLPRAAGSRLDPWVWTTQTRRRARRPPVHQLGGPGRIPHEAQARTQHHRARQGAGP